MALVRCEECGNEMSDHAKACPSCGYENNFMFCPECGKKISRRAFSCPECGYVLNNNVSTTNDYNNNNDKSGMAVASLICSFLIPLLGLILGIVVLNAYKGKNNSSKTMALIAVIISSITMIIGFFAIFGIIMASMTEYYY